MLRHASPTEPHQASPIEKFGWNLDFEAKAYAISYTHSTLALNPTAYVVRYVDPTFVHVYLILRPKYMTARLLVVFLLFCTALPYGYAQTVMAYPCTGVPTEMYNKTESYHVWVILKETDCQVQDDLRSPWSLLIGPLAFVFCFIVFKLVSRDWARRNRVLIYFRQLLWRMPYAGLGQAGSPYGVRSLAPHRYNFWNDYYGAVDKLTLTVLMGLAMFIGIFSICAWNGSISVGLVVVYALFRVYFPLMNEFLGASDKLIAAVRGELDSPQIFDDLATPAAIQRSKEVATQKCMALGHTDLASRVAGFDNLHFADADSKTVGHAKVSLLNRLYDLSSDAAFLSVEQFNLLATLDLSGALLYQSDNGLQTLTSKYGWSSKQVLSSIYIAQGNILLSFEDGRWKKVDFKLRQESVKEPLLSYNLAHPK